MTAFTLQRAAQEMLDYAEELESVTQKDYILAYSNGIAIGFDKNNKTFTTSIINAETVGTDDMPEEAWAYIPTVHNGAGQRAKVVRRDIIAHEYAKTVRQIGEDMLERIKAA